MEEIWKDIEGYEGLYQVSSLGRVKSLERIIKSKSALGKIFICRRQKEKILDCFKSGGYLLVGLNKQNKQKMIYLHRIVCLSFLENPENKPCINHKNGIKTDNRVDNLEWCTYKENMSHAINNNLAGQLGEKNGHSKLTKRKVRDIRKKYKSGNIYQKDLAKQYGVCATTISQVITRKTWKSS